MDFFGSKRIRWEYYNFESIIVYYIKCIYGREENISCEISIVYVDRVCYWFWFSELFWYDCFDILMYIFEDVDVKFLSRYEFINVYGLIVF